MLKSQAHSLYIRGYTATTAAGMKSSTTSETISVVDPNYEATATHSEFTAGLNAGNWNDNHTFLTYKNAAKTGHVLYATNKKGGHPFGYATIEHFK